MKTQKVSALLTNMSRDNLASTLADYRITGSDVYYYRRSRLLGDRIWKRQCEWPLDYFMRQKILQQSRASVRSQYKFG